MRNGHNLLCFLLLLIAGFYSHASRAENCSVGGEFTLNAPNMIYLPTLPNNTQMTNQLPGGGQITFNCDNQQPKSTWRRVVYQQKDLTGGGVSINGHHVFSSKIEGVGYSLGFQCNGGPIRYVGDATGPVGDESVLVCDTDEIPSFLTTQQPEVKAYVTYYKMGDVALESGNHTSSEPQPDVGELYLEQRSDSGPTVKSGIVSVGLSALNLDIGTRGSCLVNTANIQVNLGTVNRTDFKGQGTTAGAPTSFDIPVYCSAASDVRVGFFGVVAEGADNDALALTKGSNVAKGVGVRITYGNNGASAPSSGTTVKLNESTNLPVLKHIDISSESSAENINFTAQYVQTEGSVAAGEANSIVTFALVYN